MKATKLFYNKMLQAPDASIPRAERIKERIKYHVESVANESINALERTKSIHAAIALTTSPDVRALIPYENIQGFENALWLAKRKLVEIANESPVGQKLSGACCSIYYQASNQ